MSENSQILFKSNISDNNKLNKNGLSLLNESKLKKDILVMKIMPKNNSEDKKKIKIRNPGIDLVRMLAMYAIIIHHFIFFGDLNNKYRKYPEIRLINILTFWHVSSFALISGIVGYKSHKYSNLLYLWLQVYFYSFGIYLIVKKFKPKWIDRQKKYECLFPVMFSHYWYFTQYFGMYLILPVVNKGLSILTKTELKILVISTLAIYIILKDYLVPQFDIFVMKGGYSVLGLLIFYITGAYIGKYNTKKYNGIKKIIV